MKISLRIDYLSSRKLAAVFVVAGIVAASAFVLTRSNVWVWLAVVSIVVGVFLAPRKCYIVMRPAGYVLGRIRKALDLLGLHYKYAGNVVTIKKPPAAVRLMSVGEFTLLFFASGDNNKKASTVLRNALLKIIRQ